MIFNATFSFAENKKVIVNIDTSVLKFECEQCYKYIDSSRYMITHSKSNFVTVDNQIIRIDSIIEKKYNEYLADGGTRGSNGFNSGTIELIVKLQCQESTKGIVLNNIIQVWYDGNRFFQSGDPRLLYKNTFVRFKLNMAHKTRFVRTGCLEVCIGADHIELIPIQIESKFYPER